MELRHKLARVCTIFVLWSVLVLVEMSVLVLVEVLVAGWLPRQGLSPTNQSRSI